MTQGPPARLIGDSIERPENVRALLDAGAMFQVRTAFRATPQLAESWSAEMGGPLPTVATDRLLSDFLPIVAVENAPGAQSLFGSRLPAGTPAIVVGNERHGIRGDVLRAAAACFEIPVAGRGVTTLNVAAAAAVALTVLLADRPRSMRAGVRAERRRPAIVLASPADHVEAGSALRSAAAFGWRTVGLDDRQHVWFGVPRNLRAEGRAAARRARNPIHVLPTRASAAPPTRRVIVAGARVDGPDLRSLDLAGGPRTTIVIPDEEAVVSLDLIPGPGVSVEYGRVALPDSATRLRYRLVASIILAEVFRQVGLAAPTRPTARPPRSFGYESALEPAEPGLVDVVTAEELLEF